MTSTPVNDIGINLANYSAQSGRENAKETEVSFKDMFSNQLSEGNITGSKNTSFLASGNESEQKPGKAADNDVDSTKKDIYSDKANATEKSDSLKNDDLKDAPSVKDADKSMETDGSEEVEEISEEELEAIATALMKVVTEISEVFDVTSEEVAEAIDELSLNTTDLLSTENLSQICMEVNNLDDKAALLTDENLYEDFQTVAEDAKEIVHELASELGIPEEQLGEMLSESSKLLSDLKEGEITPLKTIDEEVDLEAEGAEDITNYSVTGNQSLANQKLSDESDENAMLDNGRATSSKNTENTSDKSSNDINGVNFNQFIDEVDMTNDSVTQVTTEQISSFDENTQNIMNQIMDHFRASVNGDMSTVEMQLHPASLGTVTVSLASKNGNVTASFTAQNDTVKQVLESQMIALKETFEERGVKVDAIEVMVQTHEFEQNLEQNQRQNENNQPKRQSNRRIRLDGSLSAEDFEELDEDERIAVEMMKANGNTVDYTA